MARTADNKPAVSRCRPHAGYAQGLCCFLAIFVPCESMSKAENLHAIVNNQIDNFADNSGTIKAVG
jgi:hypothetical protein